MRAACNLLVQEKIKNQYFVVIRGISDRAENPFLHNVAGSRTKPISLNLESANRCRSDIIKMGAALEKHKHTMNSQKNAFVR
jgi:hypothetical protein